MVFYSAHIKDPLHPRAKDNVRLYEDLLENDGVLRIDMRRDIPPINNKREENEFSDEGIMLIYEALCRQEVPVVSASLHMFNLFM
ncbi:hypothetical protein X798_07403 [Onchocerca flexuosa]|uniref:Uncharacterized protein n=1 Tax=Onchocerca flexuosa TaxID=387005 RepID=A0A238BK95_9BILA|nr:hypothetical protein X798_07403 [Onchocerca flexuosa]